MFCADPGKAEIHLVPLHKQWQLSGGAPPKIDYHRSRVTMKETDLAPLTCSLVSCQRWCWADRWCDERVRKSTQ